MRMEKGTCSAIYPSRLVEVADFGDIGRRDVCLEYNETKLRLGAQRAKNTFEKVFPEIITRFLRPQILSFM